MGFFDELFGSPDQPFSDPVQDPAGATSETLSRLTKQLAHTLRGESQQGFDSAVDVLERDDQAFRRAEDLDRASIERRRQGGQQDLAQQAAGRGLAGSATTAALQGQLDIAAGAEKDLLAERAAEQRSDVERSDLADILGGLIIGPGGDLIAGRVPSQRNEGPTPFESASGAAGQAVRLFGQFGGRGRPARRTPTPGPSGGTP